MMFEIVYIVNCIVPIFREEVGDSMETKINLELKQSSIKLFWTQKLASSLVKP